MFCFLCQHAITYKISNTEHVRCACNNYKLQELTFKCLNLYFVRVIRTLKRGIEGLQILFKWFNLDSYYPLPYSYYHSMYNCALSQSSHVDCQTLICVNPWQTWIRFRLIELVSMHLIMLMRLEPREVW